MLMHTRSGAIITPPSLRWPSVHCKIVLHINERSEMHSSKSKRNLVCAVPFGAATQIFGPIDLLLHLYVYGSWLICVSGSYFFGAIYYEKVFFFFFFQNELFAAWTYGRWPVPRNEPNPIEWKGKLFKRQNILFQCMASKYRFSVEVFVWQPHMRLMSWETDDDPCEGYI